MRVLYRSVITRGGITLATNDAPHLLPSAAQAAKLTGGVDTISGGSAAASALEAPLQPSR